MHLRRRIWTGIAGVVAVAVVGALVVATAAAVLTVRRPLPQREGEITLTSLSADVDVWRDARGIPQIYADTSADLFRAQGYVAAQDRFFEMDLRRHIASGRLSELVGESSEALRADQVVRTLGWRRVAERELLTLTPRSRDVLRAYADGVNDYLDGRSPAQISVSYSILGLQLPLDRIEPWSPADSLVWLKAVAWDLSANRDDELARGSLLAAGLPMARIEELLPPYPAEHPTIIEGSAPAETAQGRAAPSLPAAAGPAITAAAAALADLPPLLGAGDATGSNSWVVSGAYTASGKPLLANDPHLAPSAPSVWAQVGLHCRVVSEQCPYSVTGFTFASVPGVLIGHNARIAWGLTTLNGDNTDHYLEQLPDDLHYVVDGQLRPMTIRTETIEVAGGEPVELTIRSTGHGPLLSDVLDTDAAIGRSMPVDAEAGAPPSRGQGYGLSIAWTGLEPSRTMDAIVGINTAANWQEFREAAAVFDIPSQNLIYADVDGHIGYQAPGRLPVRGAGDGLVPGPGWDSAYDWTGYIDFEAMPRIEDPVGGYIVTANNLVTRDPAAPYLGSDVDRGYRAARLHEELRGLVDDAAAKSQDQRLRVQDMTHLQLDAHSPLSDVLLPYLLDTDGLDAFTMEAVDVLREWDGQDHGPSAGAAYANAVWRHVLRLTFDDELTGDLQPSGGDASLAAITALLADPGNEWWDDVTTGGVVEERDQVLERALVDARLELTRTQAKDPRRWRWDRGHVLRPTQTPLGSPPVPAPVRRLVNLSPIGVSGSSDAVNATGWDAASGSYEVTAVPSMRMAVDLGDLDASTWVQLTGASGHPGDRHYGDQLKAWAAGKTYPWPFSPAAIQEETRHRLRLVPQS